MSLIDELKGYWVSAADYDSLDVGDSTMVGIEANGDVIPVNPENKDISSASVVGGVIITKNLAGPGIKLVDSVSFMHVQNGNMDPKVKGLDTVDINIFEGHAEAELQPLYAGAGAGFNLVGGSASIFDFNLGVGLSTGAGLKDDSVEIKLAGTGLTIGRKISISVLDNSFGIDLVRTKDAVWYVGKELAVAVAVVPGAMKGAGEDLLDQFKQMPREFADAGSDLWSQVKQIPGAFAPIPGAFADAGKELGGMIADGATSVAGGVADVATGVAGGVADAATGGYNLAKDGVNAGADAAEAAAREAQQAAEAAAREAQRAAEAAAREAERLAREAEHLLKKADPRNWF